MEKKKKIGMCQLLINNRSFLCLLFEKLEKVQMLTTLP